MYIYSTFNIWKINTISYGIFYKNSWIYFLQNQLLLAVFPPLLFVIIITHYLLAIITFYVRSMHIAKNKMWFELHSTHCYTHIATNAFTLELHYHAWNQKNDASSSLGFRVLNGNLPTDRHSSPILCSWAMNT